MFYFKAETNFVKLVKSLLYDNKDHDRPGYKDQVQDFFLVHRRA